MRKLALQAEASGYSAAGTPGALSATLDGPAGRYRADQEGAVQLLTLNWLLDAEEYRYMRAFYRTGTVFGSEPFLVDLLIHHGTVDEHTAKFIPGTMELVSISGEAFAVRAAAEAHPSATIITSELLDALAYLVNVVMPAEMGD